MNDFVNALNCNGFMVDLTKPALKSSETATKRKYLTNKSILTRTEIQIHTNDLYDPRKHFLFNRLLLEIFKPWKERHQTKIIRYFPKNIQFTSLS